MTEYNVKNGVMIKKSEKKSAAVRSENWTRFEHKPRIITVNGKEAILL